MGEKKPNLTRSERIKQLEDEIEYNKNYLLKTSNESEKQKCRKMISESEKELKKLMMDKSSDKVKKVLQIFHDCKVDEWALQLQNKFLDEAFIHLEDIAVLSKRKQPLKELAHFLVKRDH